MTTASLRLRPTAFLLLLVLMAPLGRAQQIDLDGDGMGDVWQLFYGATGLSADADEDGDGYTNGKESVAGTDPFDIDSTFGFTEFTAGDGGRLLTWSSVAGKKYFLQSSGDLINWDLEQDPFEHVDLLTAGPLSAEESAALQRLRREMAALLDSE